MTPRILFVDDEPPIRELLSLCFRRQGIEVTAVSTGQQARQAVRSASFDLTILDLHLENENGLDLLGFFKSETPNMPVIIFTGAGLDESLEAAVHAGGAAALMAKTDSLYALLAEVRRHLPGAELTSHPASALPGLPQNRSSQIGPQPDLAQLP